MYVRFDSAEANRRGFHPGVFALANGLARSGRLTPDEWRWWRANNDWLDLAYPNPGEAQPELFERTRNPPVTCWFEEEGAAHLFPRVMGYLELLDRYGIACVHRRSADPGWVLYEDRLQVVVEPFQPCERG